MTSLQFSFFLTAYFVTSFAIVLGFGVLHLRSWLVRVLIFLAAAGLVAGVVIGANLVSGENYLLRIAGELSNLSRTYTTAFLLGLTTALPLILIWKRPDRSNEKFLFGLTGLGLLGVLVFGGFAAGKDILSPYLPHPGTAAASNAVSLVDDGFRIENIMDSKVIPIRIDVSPNGKVYMSGHIGIAAQSGAVVQLVEDENGKFDDLLVAPMLNRPYGLLALDDRIYVSRSGQYTRWNHGKAEQISTGAVTLLKDIDGDGIMDYYHDVLAELPGAKAPDYLHQNNDLAMDADGALYVTTAFNSDGLPPRDPLEGVILKVSGENFENKEVFAKGVRNPFGLAFGPEGELFATDNDAQSGVLGNTGDKFVHVTRGANFGHPYISESDPRTSPIALRSSYALGGLTYATSPRLPEPYRDSLFVVSYGEGRIMRVQLEKAGESYTASLVPFATVPGAVDVAAAPNGDFYVAVYPDKVVRIKLLSAAD